MAFRAGQLWQKVHTANKDPLSLYIFKKKKKFLELWKTFCGRFAKLGYIQFIFLFIYFSLFYIYYLPNYCNFIEFK